MQPKYKGLYEKKKRINRAMEAHIKRMEAKMAKLDNAAQMIDELITEKENANTQLQRDYDAIEKELGQNIGELSKLRDIQKEITNITQF